MILGSLLTGFVGDRYGRRFTYQANLAVFGLAPVVTAFLVGLLAVLIVTVLALGVEPAGRQLEEVATDPRSARSGLDALAAHPMSAA